MKNIFKWCWCKAIHPGVFTFLGAACVAVLSRDAVVEFRQSLAAPIASSNVATGDLAADTTAKVRRLVDETATQITKDLANGRATLTYQLIPAKPEASQGSH